MRVFIAKGCNDAFVQLSEALSEDAEYIVAPRNKGTKEITNAVITIENPYDRLVRHPARGLSLRYLAGEFLWYERSSDLLSEISHYAVFWKRCSDNGLTLRSSYGARLYKSREFADQWTTVRDELIRDPSSRRAMLMILEPNDLRAGINDVPCTVGLQFLIRENRLHLTAWMRSNDLYLGFCYDAAVFTLWQEKMLHALREEMHDLQMGSYTHMATSLHVYVKHFSIMADVAQSPSATVDNALFEMPRMADIGVIPRVQRFEYALRTQGREKVPLQRFEDPFADWLARCLYEG
jgi:thymidylate synthase